MRVLAAALLASLVAGCGGDDATPGRERIAAAVYPLEWAAEHIGGDDYDVVGLTPPGAEPHDLELSARDVERLRGADFVIYVGGGFQPAVEDAVGDRDDDALDVIDGLGDAHVWLDPVRFAEIVEELGRRLGRSEAAEELAVDLRALDAEYREGLAECERRVLVTSHAAFGHLASRYELTERSLTGSAPEAEPGPRDVERLVEDVRRSEVTTVFSEPLVSDRLVETIAREAGVGVATLDPLEGLSDERLAAGEDYLSVMRENLATLREALGCR